MMQKGKVFVGAIIVSGHPALNIFYWESGAAELREMLIERLGASFFPADLDAPDEGTEPR